MVRLNIIKILGAVSVLLVLFLITNFTSILVYAVGCGKPCRNTQECTPPLGVTATCVSQCSDPLGYCLGAGSCSCTTSTSTHCPLGTWSNWLACIGGYNFNFEDSLRYAAQVEQ